MESFRNSSFVYNATDNDAAPFQLGIVWNILFGISALLIVVSVYLFISFISFSKRKNFTHYDDVNRRKVEVPIARTSTDLNCDQNRKFGHVNRYEVMSLAANTKHKKISSNEMKIAQAAKAMQFVLLVTLGSNLMRGIVEQLLFFVGGNSDHVCNVLTSLMIGFTGLSIHGLVVFLWLRQYGFYSNSLMKQLSPKGLKYISFVTFIVMVVTVLVCLGIHLWWRDYTTSDGVCRPSVGSQRVSPVFAFGLVAFSTVTIQIALTFLFVYPLRAHKNQLNRFSDNATSRSTARLLQCMKRALIGATIGITTDILGSFVSIVLPENLPIFALSVIYEMDITLNIFCLFYTYQCWKDIVLPWRLAKARRVHKTSDVLTLDTQG